MYLNYIINYNYKLYRVTRLRFQTYLVPTYTTYVSKTYWVENSDDRDSYNYHCKAIWLNDSLSILFTIFYLPNDTALLDSNITHKNKLSNLEALQI